MGTLYHSDLHLPRWKRLALWMLESPVGKAVTWTVAALLLFGPLFYFGLLWGAVLLALGLGFVAGYSVARSYARNGEDVPPL